MAFSSFWLISSAALSPSLFSSFKSSLSAATLSFSWPLDDSGVSVSAGASVEAGATRVGDGR
jgi:hypothetical protein